MFAECPFSTLWLDHRAGYYPGWYEQIFDHLGIERELASLPETDDLHRYTGTYRRTSKHGAAEFSVAEEDGRLFVFGLDPYL